MRKMFWILALFAAVWAATPANAVGKITVDPNTPGAKVRTTAPETDTRLAQRVTYEARHKTVVTILADLSGMTGVTLRAGYNSQDWQVRDRKMNIFAKDTLLADLMNSIARVMKFKWSRSVLRQAQDGLRQAQDGSEVCSYRLYMDRKTLLDADAQKARSDERILRELAQRRQKLLEDLEKTASLSEEDLAKMRTEDPSDHRLVFAEQERGLGKLCREIPGLVEAVSTGQQLNVAGSQLSVAGREAVLQLLQSFENDSSPTGTSAPPFSGDIEQTTIHISGSQDPTKLAQFVFAYGDEAYMLTFGRVDIRPRFREMLRPELESWERSLNDPSLSEDGRSLISARIMEMTKAFDMAGFNPGEPLNEHPDDPALAGKIKLEPESTLLDDVQSALAESSGFAVVSDCFGKTETYGAASKDEVEIKTLLDKITKPCQYNWDKHGSVIEFRDRYWFRKRSAQIPEAWIEAWRQAFKKNGTLDIAELAQIAWLTPEQFNMNIKDDEVLSSTPASDRSMLSSLVLFQPDVLRAYGALTESERNKLFSSSGLNISEVLGDQRVVVDKPIARRNPAFLLNPDAQITLTAKRVQKGKRFEYTLTATTSEAMDPIVWTLTTPRYEPPKETTKQADGNPPANKPNSARTAE